MLTIPIFNMQGDRTGEVEFDGALLGGEVRPALLKQAIVAYLDHQRQFSARTQGRGDVKGSTRKLYRQKGTGNARVGNRRTCIRRGGGRAFGKRIPQSHVQFPKKMRRLARNSAILAKMKSEDVLIVEGLSCEQPKTKVMASMIKAVGAESGCMVATHEHDHNLVLSTRNIRGAQARHVEELNAYEVLRGRKLIFTREAIERIRRDPVCFRDSQNGEQ